MEGKRANNKEVNKLFTMTLIIAIICGLLACWMILNDVINKTINEPAARLHTYALTGVVVELTAKSNEVVVEDYNGNLWAFCGIEDWQVGDCASLLMDDQGTDSVLDDVVLSARYSAWTLTR